MTDLSCQILKESTDVLLEKQVPREKIYKITLKLNRKDELFEKPEVTPFSPDYQVHSYTSGIGFIANELSAAPSFERVHTTILLPPSEFVAEIEQDIKLAIKRYCRSRLKGIDHNIQATRWRGIRTLSASIFALFIFIGASILIYDEASVILQIISEGLAIAGWVALWFPLQSLMFTVWEYRLDKRIYTLLADMEVTVTKID